ncbi:MAG: Crp/Fnr family transcriptional regulator [Chamaesiphon sp.]|nr:Crp/Fnr family transcriptional regulator [Chamaesiphon sp.]
MSNTYYLQKRSHLNLLRADVWRIESGVVRATSWLEDGTTTLGFWGAGDVVGNVILRQENYQLECLTSVTASPLLVENCPNLVMLAHIHQLQELLIIRSCKRIEEMLLKLLTWLGGRFGEAGETGVIFKTFLTHQDLAETLNTTRVTITRSMKQLERQGTIRHLANRQLFIARSAYSSSDPAPQKLVENLTTFTSHSSIIPLVGVAASRSNRPLSVSYR